ncbi:ribonuclease H-like domain-containing protein [Tanacetum coccineum]
MDVKSAFLYGKSEEEAYVCQPPGFEDPDFPDRVYKVEKALYGLHQAPRSWSEILSTYLLDNGFQRGKIDKTLFIKRHKEVKTASTPMETQKPLLKDEDGKEVDVHMYRSMIGLLGKAKKSVKLMVEKLFRMELELISKTTAWNEFSSTMASAMIYLATNQKFNFSKYIFESMIRNLDNVSGKFLMYSRVGKGFSSRVTPLFPTMVVQNQSELGEGSANLTDPHHTPTITQSFTQPQKTKNLRSLKRTLSLVRAATTASSLEAEQDSGGGPRCQETMGDTIAQTRFENVSKHSNDSLLARGNTLRSDEDRLKLNELVELCTNLQNRVLDLEKTKTTQQNEIDSLKMRAKKLERKRSLRTHKLKRLYKVGLTARVESPGDEEDLDDADNEMFDVNVLNNEEVFVAGQNENVVEEAVDAAQVSTAATTVTITTEEITLAQALEALKTSKPKVKGIVFQEPSTTTTITTISSQQSQDKGKGIMIEEPVKPMKKKVQIMFDEEVALNLQAAFDEEERLAREKGEKEKGANIALIEEWDDIQAKINVDYQLAESLQAQEQEELSDAKKATLFQQLLEKRRKHFGGRKRKESRRRADTREFKEAKDG